MTNELKTAPWYELIDVNPNHFNCGHYPDWIVVERQGEFPAVVPATRRGTPLAYATATGAEAAADKLNAASNRAWHAYLNG